MHAFTMLVVPADSKEGADSDLDKYLPEADVVITTPFHPGYINAERLKKAPKLKLALTAGIGSDHVDLKAAADNGVTVAEITGELSKHTFVSHALSRAATQSNHATACGQVTMGFCISARRHSVVCDYNRTFQTALCKCTQQTSHAANGLVSR